MAEIEGITGGAANFVRACSLWGDVIEIARRIEGESYIVFVDRAKSLTVGLGAPRLIIGGIDPVFEPDAAAEPLGTLPRGSIALPDGGGLHPGQARAARVTLDQRRVVLRAGRRWGKSALLIALAADEAIRGRPVGYFSPLFKTAAPVFDALAFMLAPLVVNRNRSVGEIRLSTGGVIDIWSIETSTIIARGRKYALALLDEILRALTPKSLSLNAGRQLEALRANGGCTRAQRITMCDSGTAPEAGAALIGQGAPLCAMLIVPGGPSGASDAIDVPFGPGTPSAPW